MTHVSDANLKHTLSQTGQSVVIMQGCCCDLQSVCLVLFVL